LAWFELLLTVESLQSAKDFVDFYDRPVIQLAQYRHTWDGTCV